MELKDLISLIDHFPGGMGILNPQGNINALNSTLAKIFNKPREEIIGTNALSYLEEKARKTRGKALKQISKDKKPLESIDYDNGHWWKTIYQPILDNKGTVVNLAYYIQDITDKKEVEINLIKRENELEDTVLKLTTITENVKIGLYYTDVNGNFLWANKTAAEIVGRSRKEMIGKNGKYLLDSKSISKKDYLKALKILTLVKLGKRAGPDIFNIKQENGTEKIVEIQAQRIALHGENVIVGIVNDITNRKIAEIKQQESENKFQILSDQS
jgi:PAS domain S-box-containing protein